MQTPDERVRLLRMGKHGVIFCCDLTHSEGQLAADMLAREFAEVADRLRTRGHNRQHLLLLLVNSEAGVSVASTMLTDVNATQSAIEEIWRLSRDYGDTFAVVIAPQSSTLAAMFAALMNTAGSA